MDADEELDAVRAAAWALVGAAIPPACAPGVAANLAIIARHLAIVRAADVDPTIEAAEVFRA